MTDLPPGPMRRAAALGKRGPSPTGEPARIIQGQSVIDWLAGRLQAAHGEMRGMMHIVPRDTPGR